MAANQPDVGALLARIAQLELANQEALRREAEAKAREERERKAKEEALSREERERKEKEQALSRESTMREETGYASFLERKFPPLKRGHGSSKSNVDSSPTHNPATLDLAPFRDVPREQLAGVQAGVASSLKSHQETNLVLTFDNESSIANFILMILNEAREWAGLKDSLRVSSQYYLSAVRPDLVFIMGQELGIPVGVVEVKLPDHDLASTAAMEAGLFHGQLFDYLMTLRHLYGVKHPFGIATTYQHWRVCWLPESDAAAGELTPLERAHRPHLLHTPTAGLDLAAIPQILPKPKRAGKAAAPAAPAAPSGQDPGAESQGEDDDEDGDEEGAGNHPGATHANPDPAATEAAEAPNPPPTPQGQVARKLHGTQILAFDDAGLPLRIVSVLIKMGAAVCTPRELRLGNIHPLVTPDFLTWCPLPVLPASPPTFPNGNTTNFYLLEELGQGVEGRVYRACSTSGSTCAVKVFKDPHFKGTEEIKTWKRVWGLPAYTTSLLGRTAMVMPVVLTAQDGQDPKQIPRIVREHPILAEATREALRILDRKGKRHDDLFWRHVGFYQNHEGKIKAVLIDCKMAPKTDTSLKDMIQQLQLLP